MDHKNSRRVQPPRWADRFLEWYCRPELLEEIQGDVHELFFRDARVNGAARAKLSFCWNVLRFFRLKNIRKVSPSYNESAFSFAMIRNTILVFVRNFYNQPAHALLNLGGLAVGFSLSILVLLWVLFEFSFDRFHADAGNIYKVISHVEADGTLQTVDAASARINVSTVPEVQELVTVSDGERWPHQLCFRPASNANECVYQNGVYASPGFFRLFNFPIIAGNQSPLVDPTDIAISQRMAHKLYGNESPIGKTMKIDGFLEVKVTSVFTDVPHNSTMQFDFVMPYAVLRRLWGITDEQLTGSFFQTYVRTRDGVHREVLNAKLNAESVLTPELKQEKVRYEAYPLVKWRLENKFVGGELAGGRIEYVRLFIIIGVLVLVLAVINYVNLSTARATTRAKEVGVRKVTGASARSISIQFLFESFLLVFIAFILAAVLVQLALPIFNRITGEELAMNLFSGPVPLFLLAMLVVISVAAGMYPAFVMSSFQSVTILKKNNTGKGTGSERLRKSLLLVQLVIALVIVDFSVVVYHQFDYINNTNVGLEHRNMLRVEPTFDLLKKIDVFRNKLAATPVIESITTSNVNPVGAESHVVDVRWQGKAPDSRITFQAIGCSPEFVKTMGLSIVHGRDFGVVASDSVNREILVTEDAVRIMNLQQPIGEIIELRGQKCIIIGVVNDFHTQSLREARLPVILYRTPYTQTSAIYVRYKAGTTREAFEAVAAAYKDLEPTFTMKYWFQDETYDALYKTEKTASGLILVFTVIALLIALLGVVALSTFNVVRKTREMSIRRVFGASAIEVVALLARDFAVVMIVAVVIATPMAWYAAEQWLENFAYHVSLPWWYFFLTFAGIALVTVSIISVQGVRTLHSNLVEKLRIE